MQRVSGIIKDYQERLTRYVTFLRRLFVEIRWDFHHFSDHRIADWGMFCRETLLVYLLGCSEKIGSPNKTVEIDESKFGRGKYNRGHALKGQWVFGGVECESGRTFLVPVPDRTADTLTSEIRAWIEPGTKLISDCWAAYQDIGSNGYTHRTVNHSILFVNLDTGDYTNHIESTWCRVKAFLRPYNRQEDYEYHLANYIFAARCNALGVSQFTRFHAIAASTDWSSLPTSVALPSGAT